MTNQIWKFETINSVHFGRGSLESLTLAVQKLGLKRLAIVTDPNIARLPPVWGALEKLRSICLLSVFDGGQAEPSIDVALSAQVSAQSIQADGVIGIGGGSNLDVAKVVSILLAHGGCPADYFGFDRVPGPILPMIAVPTTAGTGSEVSHSAVLTDQKAQVKVSTLSQYLRPALAIVDPSLTDSCPPTVTAHSGIDALVHAIEALTNRPFFELQAVGSRAYEGANPMTRMIALEAIRQIHACLERAVKQPDDQTARDGMAFAALLAGMAFSNSGVGLIHALEYPIGALTHCSHGEGNGLLLPYVMRFNEPACQETFRQIASIFYERAEADCQSWQAIEAIEQLQRRIGIRTKLSQIGLQAGHIGQIAEKTLEIERLLSITARRPSRDDLIEILQSAL